MMVRRMSAAVAVPVAAELSHCVKSLVSVSQYTNSVEHYCEETSTVQTAGTKPQAVFNTTNRV